MKTTALLLDGVAWLSKSKENNRCEDSAGLFSPRPTQAYFR